MVCFSMGYSQSPYQIRTDSLIINSVLGETHLTVVDGGLTLTKFQDLSGDTMVMIINTLTGTVDTLPLSSFPDVGNSNYINGDTLILCGVDTITFTGTISQDSIWDGYIRYIGFDCQPDCVERQYVLGNIPCSPLIYGYTQGSLFMNYASNTDTVAGVIGFGLFISDSSSRASGFDVGAYGMELFYENNNIGSYGSIAIGENINDFEGQVDISAQYTNIKTDTDFGEKDIAKFDTLGIDLISDSIRITPTVLEINIPSNGIGKVLTDVDGNGTAEWATNNRTGWALYEDTIITRLNPQSILTTDTATIINNRHNVIDTYIPFGVDSLYGRNLTNGYLIGELGASYSARINFDAKTSTVSDFGSVVMDIGSDDNNPIVINSRIFTFPKGQNVWHSFSFTTSLYALGTFVSNGCKIRLVAGDGTMDIANIQFFITKTTDSNTP